MCIVSRMRFTFRLRRVGIVIVANNINSFGIREWFGAYRNRMFQLLPEVRPQLNEVMRGVGLLLVCQKPVQLLLLRNVRGIKWTRLVDQKYVEQEVKDPHKTNSEMF